MYFTYYKYTTQNILLRVLNNRINTSRTTSSFQVFKNMDSALLNINLSERLSSLVRPVNYKLLLYPNLNTGTFEGNVQITVITKQEKDCIALHTKFLDILKVQVHKGEAEVDVSKFLEIEQIEQLLIKFNETLNPGSYKISIDFKGDLTRNIIGFYLSRLKDGRTMVASKFEPTYTRQAFPCFDEPDFKATYDITLVKPSSYIALSNMNEISKKINEDNKTETVTFATSVPMSTYLACFVICDFTHIEEEIQTNGIGKNFKLRSFAQKNQMHKINFAQDIGKRATEFYIKYYNVPFPLPKLDMIAIPDYQSGATEHWGLITYRETSFLVDEAIASAENKISVANTIAHELAHMWFGNLVTLKWWDDLWLNEGFASYMQVKSLNAIEPSWSMLDQFLIKSLHSVLGIDAKLSSHPIVQTVATPDQITAIFDSISYSKGASVIRMLEGFLGEENFRLGVSDYLKKYQFGNTITQDLLSSLEPYFKKDNPNLSISYIMDTWTRQMGYPLVTVAEGDNPNTVVLTQSRFLIDPTAQYDRNESQFKYRWFIPITYKTNKGIHEKTVWFSDKEDNITLNLGADEKVVKINNNQVGYYRVNYTNEMWKEIIQMLNNKSETFTISDRAHLLNEVFALAQAEVVPYELALELSMYLRVEEDYVPWTAASVIFNKLSDKLFGTPAKELLEKYIQNLIQPMYEKQSWTRSNTTIIQSLVRTRVLTLAAQSSLPAAVREVRELFSSWLASHGTATPLQIEPQLRNLVYYFGMKSASQADWDKLWSIYREEEDVQEKSKLRTALSAPRDVDILKRYLELAWDEKNIRSQDYLSVVQQISSNPSGCDMVWEWVKANWPALVERFTLNSRYLGQMIPGITNNFSTEERLGEMERLFAQYPEAGAGESGRRAALEAVRGNVRWAAAHRDALRAWLHAHV